MLAPAARPHAPPRPAEDSFRAPSFSSGGGDRTTFRPRPDKPPTSGSRRSSATGADDAAAAGTPALSKAGGTSATAGRPQGTSLQAFKTEASVDAYLTNLAHELSMIAEQPTTIFKSQAVDPVESLGQALEVLDATVGTLSDVQSRAMRHVSFLSVRRGSVLRADVMCLSDIMDVAFRASHVAGQRCGPSAGGTMARGLLRDVQLPRSAIGAAALFAGMWEGSVAHRAVPP